MSTAALADRLGEASPRFKARMAGVFQLLEAVTASFGRGYSFSAGLLSLATPRLQQPISWDTSGYFGWGSHPRSSGWRAISHGRFSCMSCLNL